MSHHDFRQRDGFSNGEAPLSCTNQLSHSTAARLIAVINHHDRFEVFLQRLSIDRHLHSPSIWSSSIHHANKDNRLDTLVHTKVTLYASPIPRRHKIYACTAWVLLLSADSWLVRKSGASPLKPSRCLKSWCDIFKFVCMCLLAVAKFVYLKLLVCLQ